MDKQNKMHRRLRIGTKIRLVGYEVAEADGVFEIGPSECITRRGPCPVR